MRKKIVIAGLLLAIIGFQAAAQDAQTVVVSGDLTTIYTLGNASNEQRIDDPYAAGAFFNSQSAGIRKNGFYTAANLYATFHPFPWLEGYFKLYAVQRPGSFHLHLQMEQMGAQSFAPSVDAVYGRASVLRALGLDLPIEIILKAGKYKAQASQFGIISKYKTEQVLYMMNTKTDFTYELGVALDDPVKMNFFAATNYLLNESVQAYYDEDGAFLHGNQILNKYSPQFLLGLNLRDFSPADAVTLDAEVLYGMNVSNIYSGNAVGGSIRATLNAMDGFSIPIGISAAFHEKNIDMLGQTALTIDTTNAAAGGTVTTDFRESLGFALGVGARYSAETVSLDCNLAGTFFNIKHYYRDDLVIIKMSLDAMATIANNYFIGGGIILGSLTEAEWKTRSGITDEDYFHTFKLSENIGYEIYGGVNLGGSSRFVIGFNQNKGISMNNMLEFKHEGQMKYKQADSNWAQDQLAEAGGLYFKFFFKF